MAANPRVTLYMLYFTLMKQIAKEDGKDLNGAYLEQLFFDDTCGKNQILQDIIKRMYRDEISIGEAISQIIKYIRFSGIEMRKFFDAIPQIAKDVCGDTVWEKDGSKNFLVELQKMLKKLLAIIDDLYQKEAEDNDIFSELANGNMEIVREENGDLSEDYSGEVQDAIEDYLDLTEQKTKIGKMIESEGTKPADVLAFVVKNWSYLYNSQEVYEVIEYCIANAAEVNDNSYLRKRLRDFTKFVSLVQEYSKYRSRVEKACDSRWQEGWLEYFDE